VGGRSRGGARSDSGTAFRGATGEQGTDKCGPHCTAQFAAGVLARQLARAKLIRGNLLKANSEPLAVDSIVVNSVTRRDGRFAGALDLSRA